MALPRFGCGEIRNTETSRPGSRRSTYRDEVENLDPCFGFLSAVQESETHLVRRCDEQSITREIPVGDRLAVDSRNEVSCLNARTFGRRTSDHARDTPVGGRFVE